MIRKVILPVILLLGSILSIVSAQSDQPLLVISRGDLYTWAGVADSEPEPYTACQPPDERIVYSPQVGPDSMLILQTWPRIVIEVLEREGGIGGGPLPNNIWLCNGNELTLIAQQPENASFFQPNVPDNVLVRSRVTWSPDGTKIAWTEGDISSEDYTLNIYTLDTGEVSQVAIDMPQQYGIPQPPLLSWTEAGLAGPSTRFVPNSPEFSVFEVIIFAETGETLGTFPVTSTRNPEAFTRDQFPIVDQGRSYWGLRYDDGSFGLLDLQTGELSYLSEDAAPALYSPADPDGTALVQTLNADGRLVWTLAYGDELFTRPDGRTEVFPDTVSSYIEPGPSGRVAYIQDFTSIWVWNNPTEALQMPTIEANPEAQIFGIDGISWLSTEWRIIRELELDNPFTIFTCPGFVQSQLQEGVTAINTDSVPNNLRAEPNLNAERIGEIPPGATVQVVAGPVCDQGYAWWQVEYNGQFGWTVEGEGSEYWIEPVRQ